MGFREFIWNSMNHYSFVLKAGRPIACQFFILAGLFKKYSMGDQPIQNLNPLLHYYLKKLNDIEDSEE